MYPWHQARDVFHAYHELAPTMPDELTVQIGMVAGPDGHSVVYLAPVWSSSADPIGMVRAARGIGDATCKGDCPDAVQQDADPAGSLHPVGTTSRDADAHPAVVQRRRDRRARRRWRHPSVGIQRHRHPSLPWRGDPRAHRTDRIRHSRAALRRRGARRVGTRRQRDTPPGLGRIRCTPIWRRTPSTADTRI